MSVREGRSKFRGTLLEAEAVDTVEEVLKVVEGTNVPAVEDTVTKAVVKGVIAEEDTAQDDTDDTSETIEVSEEA